MIIVKKLDRYILSKFLLIFAGAFFICLFVFMMQFTWRYVDELIGKGLSLEILGQFFWYMALTLVPQALPLAILLASLITFGNLGESFELLSIKAAGVSLVRTMRPMALTAVLLCGVSFYFQNVTSPDAQINLRTLLFSMKANSPAVEIPEGVFYNGVPNVNIYVQRKNAETGMLYQTIIYKTDQGFDRAQIVLADSARLEVTADKMHLRLDLWNGEQAQALQAIGGAGMSTGRMDEPFDRETFIYKQLLIDFDSNFNLMDKEMLSGMASAKNMKQIEASVDSMNRELDSLGHVYYADAQRQFYKNPAIARRDSLELARMVAARSMKVNLDTLFAHAAPTAIDGARSTAASRVRTVQAELEWKEMNNTQTERSVRSHWVEWHQKITFSLACIFFFFIGAPLGAIIRKGGLGMPTVISVIIFIFWYIINTSGMKMARDGSINMVFGMWVSSAVLVPFDIFLTYKANKDSVVFNMESYVNFFRRLFGLRTKRHIARKEVIIDDPNLATMPARLTALVEACRAYNETHHLLRAPSYVRIFFRYTPDEEVEAINDRLEAIVEELSNSRERLILGLINQYPILYVRAHTSPFHSKWLNEAAGVFFPLGLVLWFRMWRFRLHLHKDMRAIVRTSTALTDVIEGRKVSEADEGEARRLPHIPRPKLPAKRNKKWVISALAALLIILLSIFALSYWQKHRAAHAPAPGTEKSEKPAEALPQKEEALPQRGETRPQKAGPLPQEAEPLRQLKPITR